MHRARLCGTFGKENREGSPGDNAEIPKDLSEENGTIIPNSKSSCSYMVGATRPISRNISPLKNIL